MKRILVFRFSAMGDVALLLPVLRGVLNDNLDAEILLVTRTGFSVFFEDIERLKVLEFDPLKKHKGILGLLNLFNEIRSIFNPDVVVDLHKVLRTIILDAFYVITGHKVLIINKGNIEKKRIIRTKKIKELMTTVDRYSSVFKKAGIVHSISKSNPLSSTQTNNDEALTILKICDNKTFKIGIAPFAKHPQKVWGDEKIIELIDKLSETHNCHFFLFGGGKHEIERMQCISEGRMNCTIVANKIPFKSELSLISKLDIFISMDSANMHFATLQQVPTFTIWGATHPAFGFRAYNQHDDFNVQYPANLLPCRPCSVFGNKKCIYDDIRCMNKIESYTVFDKVNIFLNETNMFAGKHKHG